MKFCIFNLLCWRWLTVFILNIFNLKLLDTMLKLLCWRSCFGYSCVDCIYFDCFVFWNFAYFRYIKLVPILILLARCFCRIDRIKGLDVSFLKNQIPFRSDQYWRSNARNSEIGKCLALSLFETYVTACGCSLRMPFVKYQFYFFSIIFL